MTPYKLKQLIYAQISSLLGSYKLNTVVPAIWIGTPEIKTVVTGLECLIPFLPSRSTHGNQLLEEKWEITLTQHTTLNQETTINQATQILRSYLRPSEVIFLQRPKQTSSMQDIPILSQAIVNYYSKEILRTK